MSDAELLELLRGIVDESGVSIKFSDDETGRGLNPLKNAIKEAIEESNKVTSKPTPAQQAANKNSEATAENTDASKKSLESIDKETGKIHDQILDLEKAEEKNAKLTHAQMQRLLEMVGNMVLSMASMSFDATKSKLGWLKELEKSGIRLAGGFDESFTKLANDAKMSHDAFTKMLANNSKQVAKMNALGSETMASMMEASGNLVGKFGYNADEASKIMMHYMNTIASTDDADQLRNRNITKEVEILGKQMKNLSLATGKSVELLLQEQEQRRNNLLMEKIARDPIMGKFLQMGLNAGLSEEVMLAAITGRPNEKSSQMNITAGGRALNRGLQQAAINIRSGRMGVEDLVPFLSGIQNDGRIINDVNSIDNMSYGLAGAITDAAIGDTLFQLSQFRRNLLNANASKQVGKGSDEENALNSIANAESKKNILSNIHTDKLALSLRNATTALDIFSKGLDATINTIEDMNDKFYLVMAGMSSFAIDSALKTWTINRLLDKMVPSLTKLTTVEGWLDLITLKPIRNAMGTLKTSIESFGTALLQSGKFVRGSALLAGASLFIFQKQLIESVLGWDRETNPILHTLGRVGIGIISGAAIGGSIAGAKGALWGAVAGATGSALWTLYDFIWGDKKKGDAKLDNYPAKNINYNNSTSKVIQNNSEIRNISNEQMTTELKGIRENTKKSAEVKDEISKIREENNLKTDATYYMFSASPV